MPLIQPYDTLETIRHPFDQEKNGLIGDLFLYVVHILDNLHDLVIGENCLIGGLILYPGFLYPVSSEVLNISP